MTDQNLHTESEQNLEQVASENSDEQALWPSPGKMLKKLREEYGYSPEKVSQSLYITAHYVKALEDDNYSKLPGHTFIKGYYKAYAEFLGADTEHVLNCYLNYLENSSQEGTQAAQADEIKNRNKSILWVTALIVLIGVIAGGIWMMNNANALPMPVVLEKINEQ